MGEVGLDDVLAVAGADVSVGLMLEERGCGDGGVLVCSN